MLACPQIRKFFVVVKLILEFESTVQHSLDINSGLSLLLEEEEARVRKKTSEVFCVTCIKPRSCTRNCRPALHILLCASHTNADLHQRRSSVKENTFRCFWVEMKWCMWGGRGLRTTYQQPAAAWKLPCPAWWCLSLCTSAVQKDYAGTALLREVCSTVHHLSPPSPQTWSTWKDWGKEKVELTDVFIWCTQSLWRCWINVLFCHWSKIIYLYWNS